MDFRGESSDSMGRRRELVKNENIFATGRLEPPFARTNSDRFFHKALEFPC